MSQKADDDLAELVEAARAYFIRSDLTRLDRESVQSANRLGCVLDRFGWSVRQAATESDEGSATQA